MLQRMQRLMTYEEVTAFAPRWALGQVERMRQACEAILRKPKDAKLLDSGSLGEIRRVQFLLANVVCTLCEHGRASEPIP